MLFPNEKQKVAEVIQIAEEFGYGNLIAHLRRAWALRLMKSNPLLTYEDAVEATNSSAYPEVIEEE